MTEIKCPHCNHIFTIDESITDSIIQQIRNSEFEAELQKQVHQQLEIANSKHAQEIQKEKFAHENAMADLKTKLDNAEANNKAIIAEQTADFRKQIAELQGKINAFENEKKLAVSNAKSESQESIHSQELIIKDLQNQLSNEKQKSAIADNNHKNEIAIIRKNYEDEIARVQDFKSKLATKNIGEDLEQWCLSQYEQFIRPNLTSASFEKDNKATKVDGETKGTKGDFIFRDTKDGEEYISIMFEMKNETENGKTKNEHHFETLDKNRVKKNCEYAVLVSTLEPESELYNRGIVDMSYKYKNMFVVRPQFFLAIISLLRSYAIKTLDYKHQIADYQSANMSYQTLQETIQKFGSSFVPACQKAGKSYTTAISSIDDAIKKLQKTKTELETWYKSMGVSQQLVEQLANNPQQFLPESK